MEDGIYNSPSLSPSPSPVPRLTMACTVEALEAVMALMFLSSPSISAVSRLSYSAVFNFGDSNSDTGGLAASIGFPVGPPNGKSFFGKPTGRFSDGRLIIDFLMKEMDMPFLNPYLDSIGGRDFRYGSNFATGGAIVMPANAALTNPFSFNVQVSQFIRFKTRVLELLQCDGEVREHLPWAADFRQGLYTIDIGQNDINGAFFLMSESEVLAYVPKILSELEIGVKRLYEEGARNFWIHNTGPLGCLPRIIATFGKRSSIIRDQFGCLEFINHAAVTFNLQLYDLCKNLRVQFPDLNVTYVDIFSIKLDLIANFSRYGFKEPIAACCGHGGLPLNVDDEIGCGQVKTVNGSVVKARPCKNRGEYVNWDGIHYTEAANRFVCQQIIDGNYTDPPMRLEPWADILP